MWVWVGGTISGLVELSCHGTSEYDRGSICSVVVVAGYFNQSRDKSMDKFIVWRRVDGKQAQVVNQLRKGDRVELYKVAMDGCSPAWCDVATFRQEFSRKPVTEARYRVPAYRVV